METLSPIEALKYYTEDGADYINDYLRNGTVDDVTQYDLDYFQNAINILDTTMTTIPDDVKVV